MSQCLTYRLLLQLFEGEGTSAQRNHLEECEACRTRYRRLENDLTAIGQVLEGEPPSRTVVVNPTGFPLRWVATSAVLVLALVVLWGSFSMWNSFPSQRHERAGNEEVWEFVQDVSTALFLPEEAIAEQTWLEAMDFHDFSVPREEERPCVDAPLRNGEEFSNETAGDFSGYVFPGLCSG